MKPISHTLFAKISQMLILMVGVILLFSFFAFQSMKTTYDRLFYQKFRETITIAVTFIENELDMISEMTLYLSTDEILQSYIREIEDTVDYQRSQTRDKVRDILFKQAYGETYFSLIELHLLSGDIIDVGRDMGSYASEYNPEVKLLLMYKDGLDFFQVGQNGYLMNIRNIRDTSSLDFFSMGTMIVYFDVDRLVEKFQRQIPFYSELNLAVIKDGVLLSKDIHSDRLLESLSGIEEGFSTQKIGEESYFITAVTGKRDGWQYVGYVSLFEVDRINRNIWISLIISHGLLAFALISAGRLYVKKFTIPLEDLSHKLRAFELNDFTISLNPHVSHGTTEEIQNLYRDVDLALQKIQSQVYEDYVKQMSLQKTQLQMLQSQINPHFLYNTLDSIGWLAKSCGDKDIARMVLSLGRLLRHSLSEKREQISLKEELDLLDDYLSIQKIRFQEKLHYDCEINVDKNAVLVLPFILQPLLENSIKYGIEAGAGSLNMSLKINKMANDDLIINVLDNGVGFPRVVLDSFYQSELKERELDSNLGLGIRNIYSRLNLYYKGKATFVISNRSEGGACITLTLPLDREDSL